MNTSRPVSTRICKCGQQFELISRGQRYCPACREQRAAAEAARKERVRHRVCSCGQHFKAETGHQRSCPTCLAARKTAEEARPPRKCKRCGQIKHGVRNAWCPACWDAARAEMRARYKVTVASAPIEHDLDKSDLVNLVLSFAALLVRGAKEDGTRKTVQPPTVKEVSLEWIDAENQETIDLIAEELLKDIIL